jgi:hypothetical protein
MPRISAVVLASAGLLFTACNSDPAATGADDAGTNADGSDTTDGGGEPIVCGRLTTPCRTGEACVSAEDCASGFCRDAVCRDIVPSDGVQNGDETDVDCGGTASPPCTDGKQCKAAQDCTSGVCTTNVCQVPSPTDGVRNADESDIDCGGTNAPKCAVGKTCAGDDDCDNVRCDATTKKCNPPNDGDGLKNADETGIDCGGPTTTKKCPTGQGCTTQSDCDKAKCNDGTNVCDPPSPTDEIQNGNETDIDCGGVGGGTVTKRCVEGKKCKVDGDCTDFCTGSVCVAGRSCKGSVDAATSGIVTCGRGETSDPNRVHDSCCRSLPLPGTPAARLDKYEVTAGRFRQFVETVGPNIRQWAKNEIDNNTATGQRLAADLPANMRPLLPASATPGDPMNLVMQIGGTVMDSRHPSTAQGCYNDTGSYGHNTYWLPQTTLQAHFGDGHAARRFTKAQYDEKSMNCSPYWMYAAFCAWDGGRLPTTAEVQRVWTARYPWGADFAEPPVVANGPPRAPASGINFTETVNQNNNNLYFYQFPAAANANDISVYIAAPGRFFRDATTIKGEGESWFDLAANNFEMVKHLASGSSTFCDFNVFFGDTVNGTTCKDGAQSGVVRATGLQTVQWIGGSWEGHGIGNPVGSTQEGMVQYGKTGFRCARPAVP